MKKLAVLLSCCLYAICIQSETLSSPDGRITLDFSLTGDGKPQYSLQYDGKPVVQPSTLGFDLTDGRSLKDGFDIASVSTSHTDRTWEPVWGEVSEIRDKFNEMSVDLLHKPDSMKMVLRFRLFDDGLGFRYEFPKQQNLSYFRVLDELTEFRLAGDHKTFWIPANFDSNEYYYTTSKFSEIDARSADGRGIGTHKIASPTGVQSPLMMKSSDGLYINIFEAALADYPAMHLNADTSALSLNVMLAPDAYGTKAYLQTPCKTPWRTVIVSDDATDILASKTILNLNEPCKIEDTGFIKPQKYIGVWWEMHVPLHGSWNYADIGNVKLDSVDWNKLVPNGRHAANTVNVKKYIDFAAEHGFSSVLVEGWNVGWEDWAGNWKEEVFDFVTPYPDFDIAELSEYAKSKGVKLMMHHETSGSASNYERRLDEAVDFMKKYGYDAVKTGYVGWIIPRGEAHDGQWMVNHYSRVIKKMAENDIMINQHEPVRPTGQHRTYPNLMACEAARGNEFNAWSYGNPPEHETILPFTRLMGGPMDYTPGIFEIKMSAYQPGNDCQVHTTLAKQLALYVTMYSPLQMAADLPENYEKHPDAFKFIEDVAVDWDDTKILEAEPGDYITIARKAKGSDEWFIGAITDENPRETEIPLYFLDKGKKYIATIYSDAANAHWKDNPKAYKITIKTVTSKSKLNLKLACGGGCAISLRPRP